MSRLRARLARIGHAEPSKGGQAARRLTLPTAEGVALTFAPTQGQSTGIATPAMHGGLATVSGRPRR